MKDPFIKTYKMFDKDLCEQVIQTFEDGMAINNPDIYRRNNEFRTDYQMEMNSIINKGCYEIDLRNTYCSTPFFKGLHEGFEQYISELNLKDIIGPTYYKNMLIQRSVADEFESYSSWHCESDNLDRSDRAMAFMLYLNDDFEGGETEFKYQKYKEIPEQGNLVIWPAGYTHTHRGAMLTSGVKYIATGWAFFAGGT